MEELFTYLEIAGAIVGLVYLWLEYRASIYLWIAGLVMPAIYIFVYYRAGLYADFAYNVYYLLAAVYGWMAWKKSERRRKNIIDKEPKESVACVVDSGIRSVLAESRVLIIALPFIAGLLFLAIGVILLLLTDSQVPWANAFNVSMSIVAMWLLAKKYVEQWLVWIVADVASAWLYMDMGLYYTAALYGLYTVIAFFGYIKWRKMMTTRIEKQV